MLLHRLLLTQILLGLLLFGCSQDKPLPLRRLTVGVVSYDTGFRVDKYERFKDYLAEQTHTVVELEPAFNELKAVEQVHDKAWSIVFAPPGLAAIAIGKEQYIPIFPMQGVNNLRSVMVVREDSPIQKVKDLANKVVALGEPGSAAGYYLPLYDLYGLTLAEVRFAPTPTTVLTWLSQGTVAAGALSEEEFQQHRYEFGRVKFRVLHISRSIPPGVVLLGPTVERNQQEQVKTAMSNALASVAADAGYIPNAQLPDYKDFVPFVEKVRPIEAQVRKKPAVLTPSK